jgi:hypothetical protein
VVFSVADGKVVIPEVPKGARFGTAMVYPGGFGYEYSATGDFFSDQVAFFDPSGKTLSRPDFKATILTGSREIPMVQTPSGDVRGSSSTTVGSASAAGDNTICARV